LSGSEVGLSSINVGLLPRCDFALPTALGQRSLAEAIVRVGGNSLMPKTAVEVKVADISLPTKTTIASSSLVEGLIRDQRKTLDLLGKVSPLSVDDISVDSEGRVVIDNPEFAQRLAHGLERAGAAEANNGICGLGCVEADVVFAEGN